MRLQDQVAVVTGGASGIGYEIARRAAAFEMKLIYTDVISQKDIERELGIEDGDKVRVLLAQALFGDPDILLLDEPTNRLDVDSILWLEEFLADFRNTVIVVSHDRHFLNKVCTHTADIDFGTIQLHTGNYDFWLQASELALRHQRAKTAKNEEKTKELKAFIARFSANASKSRQATSRKKMLGKLSAENFRPSSRKYPHVVFNPERLRAKAVVRLNGISHSIAGESLIKIR